MPDFVPSHGGHFDIAIGRDVLVTSGNDLDDHKNTSDDNKYLEGIAKKEEKTLATGSLEIRVAKRGVNVAKYWFLDLVGSGIKLQH